MTIKIEVSDLIAARILNSIEDAIEHMKVQALQYVENEKFDDAKRCTQRIKDWQHMLDNLQSQCNK